MSMKKDHQNLLQDFIGFVEGLETSAQRQQFFEAILTPQELQEIPRRLEIVKLLRQGVVQRDIAQKLGVGIATITRGARVKDEAIFEALDT